MSHDARAGAPFDYTLRCAPSGPVQRVPSRAEPRASERPAENGPFAAPRRVLVVDDSADHAESLARLLRIWGFDVRAANSGHEALGIAAHYRPHAVLLDIGLPVMNGYEVAARLRDLPGQREVVVVAISGHTPRTENDPARSGIDRYLVKPVDPPALEELLATILTPRTLPDSGVWMDS